MLKLLISISVVLSAVLAVVVEDIFIPEDCSSFATTSDHLLIEFEASDKDGVIGKSVRSPGQLQHLVVDDSTPIGRAVKGMCINGTRRVTWQDWASVSMAPLPLEKYLFGENITNSEITVEFKVMGVTSAEDYQIFNLMKMKNYPAVTDMIDRKKGVNALDEWGQSILMLATREGELTVVATLLNARMPKVNVNMAKSSGYTALFYAIENRDTNILKALLRRGANPNVSLKQEGAVGNTPLHFACLMEKQKHTELLLEFGADVMAVNEYGQYPLQLLPRDAVRSTKLYFKRMFEDALAKMEKEENAKNENRARNDL
mmetsp:Transcript_25754/g.43400  ORF Transcript_25754/g.43400 Transcript_25754/m.43400 type:complete len:316 (+) Transcript_25754:103-1050(+)|eukprot:CAMPEP_0114431218 /NCGR_PEP_ID=MMETSP0103-20121206/10478_1 /TAXON_ID=37642 ORGANISM="Paraphysomonas imperforata, Strain PA2" /NCGR_SAMPLE_ID=MMETSP0103 /ASSEMBLY_ACC=CAM_ASM_000201 /LENGTH=315 /DNA_ID=CAMNT_0001600759 /DNA_START=104 /DNA_END=1051 /DNA_ORIENTATION=+